MTTADDEARDEAERAVLGAMLLSTAAIERATEKLRVADLYRPRHATIFNRVLELWAGEKPTDVRSVIVALADAGDLDRAGGGNYLHDLIAPVPSTMDIDHHIRKVGEHAHLRRFSEGLARLGDAHRIADGTVRAERVAAALTELAEMTGGSVADRQTTARRVSLRPFLDGTYVPPQPIVGAEREAGAARLLYAGRWHTAIGLTTAGKSWWALWHAVAELRRGNTVAYGHFEEPSPAGTLDRIRCVAPDLDIDTIDKLLVWVDCSTRFTGPSEWSATVPDHATLAVLDGINAACSMHGWDVNAPDAVGNYRALFVTPITRRGTAALSLGHPPKARDRQGERHGFGSSAWLDEVDGVGFRIEAAKSTPIRRGREGYSAAYVVKDRYGQVEVLGTAEEARESGWYYVGAFHVDSSPALNNTLLWMTAPSSTPAGDPRSKYDVLADDIARVLAEPGGHRFASVRALKSRLRAAEVPFGNDDLEAALVKLATRGVIEWPEVESGKSRPGWLSPTTPASEPEHLWPDATE
jgi:hypothetical protein